MKKRGLSKYQQRKIDNNDNKIKYIQTVRNLFEQNLHSLKNSPQGIKNSEQFKSIYNKNKNINQLANVGMYVKF